MSTVVVYCHIYDIHARARARVVVATQSPIFRTVLTFLSVDSQLLDCLQSYEHEVWHNDTTAAPLAKAKEEEVAASAHDHSLAYVEHGGVRVVLIVDLWHPELQDDAERERVRHDFAWNDGIPYTP